MIDALLKIVEKLTELLKARQQLRERQFERLVAPLFKDLQTVHQDYLEMFTACRKALVEGDDLSIVAEHLMAERLVREALRASIRALAESFARIDQLGQFSEFFLKVHSYFLPSELLTGSVATDLLRQMDEWIEQEQRAAFMPTGVDLKYARTFLLESVDRTLEHLRRKWQEIASSYAETLVQATG